MENEVLVTGHGAEGQMWTTHGVWGEGQMRDKCGRQMAHQSMEGADMGKTWSRGDRVGRGGGDRGVERMP